MTWVGKLHNHIERDRDRDRDRQRDSQTFYINWIIWRTKCGTIYKSISRLKEKEQEMQKYTLRLFILNRCNSSTS